MSARLGGTELIASLAKANGITLEEATKFTAEMSGKGTEWVKKQLAEVMAADKKSIENNQKAKVNAPKPAENMTADQVKNEVDKKVADTNKGTQNVNMNVKHEVQVPAVMDALQREIVKDQSLFASWGARADSDYTTPPVAKGR